MKLFNINLDFKFNKKNRNSVIGIDIGTSSIKIVQLKKERGVAVLETYGELSLGSYAGLELGQSTNLDAPKIAEALLDLIREANITSNNAGMSIPFSSSLTSLILMPDLSANKLASMIPIEARKYIPVPISEVTLDWFIIPDEKKIHHDEDDEDDRSGMVNKVKKTEVLLVAIHNNTLNKYNEIVNTANLEASFFEIEIFSAIRAVVDENITTVMVLDMGAESTKLYIVEYGVVKKSHVINSGGQDITQALAKSIGVSISKAEEYKRGHGADYRSADADREEDKLVFKDIIIQGLDRIFSEASKVSVQYQKKYNKNIGTVILTGGGATIKGLLPIAEKYFETNVILSNPFSKIVAPAFFEDVLKEVGPEFAVAIGLALRRLQEI